MNSSANSDRKLMTKKIVSAIVCVAGLFVPWQAFRYVLEFIFRSVSLIWFVSYDTALYVWIASVLILFFLKSKLKWLTLALSPFVLIPVYWFGSGSIDYFKGRAEFQAVGLMSAGYDNLDEEYRVWKAPSSCLVMGDEFYTQSPNNSAIKFWTKLLGYQKGVFHGKYPSKKEVFDFLEKNSQSVQFTMDSVGFNTVLNGQSIKLQYQKIYSYDVLKIFIKSNSAKVALMNNEVILFQLIQPRFGSVYLADAKTGKIFADYFPDNELQM
jgi:hypothetical protein